jgi:hypothetical protein
MALCRHLVTRRFPHRAPVTIGSLHWHWDGYRYVWLGGNYVGGPPRRGHYVPGRWRWNGVRYIWVPAHWG